MPLRWKRDPLGATERRLRGERPRLDEQHLEQLVRLASGERRSPRRAARPVLALVGAATVLCTVSAFGGVSYAVQSVRDAVGNNSASQGPNVTDGKSKSSSGVQYGTGGCIENVNPHGQT